MKEIIKNFKGKRILVIGDLILDVYNQGTITRLSPEAPVPLIKVDKRTYCLGGASNVANNIVDLGGFAYVCGVVGDDSTADLFREELKKKNIDCKGIFTDKTRQTTKKTRVIAKYPHQPGQQVVRLDEEDTHNISSEIEKEVTAYLKKISKSVDVVICSDYNKGFITKGLAEGIKDIFKDKIIIVDTKPNKIHFFKGCNWFAPNIIEGEKMAGLQYKGVDNKEQLKKMGDAFLKNLNPEHVLLTCGGEGMILYSFKDDSFEHIPTEAKEVYDVSGAGDTVVSALGLALAAGADPKTAAKISNFAAGIVVGKSGTATTNVEELLKTIL